MGTAASFPSAQDGSFVVETHTRESVRRRWRWTLRIAGAGLLAWGVLRLIALPSAPQIVWAPADASFDIKPWAYVSRTAGGEHAAIEGLDGAWFRRPGGGYAKHWDPTLEIEFVCVTPLCRRALLLPFSGRLTGNPYSRFAVYRQQGEIVVVEGRPWARYVCE